MTTIYLLHHGESAKKVLTPGGREQSQLAVWHFKRDFDDKGFAGWRAPEAECIETAFIFSRMTGIPIGYHDDLHLMCARKTSAHRTFADTALRTKMPNLMIIGHDENRAHLILIVQRLCGRDIIPPHLGPGQLLKFTEARGYELLI